MERWSICWCSIQEDHIWQGHMMFTLENSHMLGISGDVALWVVCVAWGSVPMLMAKEPKWIAPGAEGIFPPTGGSFSPEGRVPGMVVAVPMRREESWMTAFSSYKDCIFDALHKHRLYLAIATSRVTVIDSSCLLAWLDKAMLHWSGIGWMNHSDASFVVGGNFMSPLNWYKDLGK